MGTGKGYTVLQLIETFMKETGVNLKIIFSSKRKGDVAKNYADITKAKRNLNWRPRRSLEEMCDSAFKALKWYPSLILLNINDNNKLFKKKSSKK